MPATDEKLRQLAISEAEYEAIVERLGREPNDLELGLFGSLWSEHCGYKHSKPLLRMLPSESPRLLVSPGEENAGVIDIGDGLAVVMKIESHNHPSAIEPYEGAATGVGGIVRDIFTMGARPIALLNSLRFGPLDDPHNRRLFSGVVGGISGYGNCLGIPDIGGEIFFSSAYTGNPLVNAMCVGIMEKSNLVSATAGAAGNLLMLVGADTGRDGIHGASGLASRSFEEEREMRPAVQVGNPFLEKVLIEACLEAVAAGAVVGLQDLGAAGLTSAAVEAAAKTGAGIEIDVALVPRRETGMTPYEVMLSESQERMLVVVREDQVSAVERIFDEWDLHSTVIGKVTDDGQARILDGNLRAGTAPVQTLVDAPQYRLDGVPPADMLAAQAYDLDSVPLPKDGAEAVLLRLLASPNIASKHTVYRQYDHQVQTNTVVGPGSDAAVLRIKGTSRAIALTTDGNGRHCFLDPRAGGAMAVAEACRNVSCVGAEPVALTDCLNFGNPEKPEGYYQLEEAVRGMAEACKVLGVPVVSGNVSLYNETDGRGIYPTPVIGALGLLEDGAAHVDSAFKRESDVVYLLGANVDGDAAGLAGSEYLEVEHGLVAGQPRIDLQLESAVQRACRRAVREGVAASAHDCSDGGLAVALAESCIQGEVGFVCDASLPGRWDAALFGEAPSRIVVSVPVERTADFQRVCREELAPFAALGRVEGSRLAWPGFLDADVPAMKDAWTHGLEIAAGG